MEHQYTIEMSYYKNEILIMKTISYMYNPLFDTDNILLSGREMLKAQYEAIKKVYDKVIVSVVQKNGEVAGTAEYKIDELRQKGERT